MFEIEKLEAMDIDEEIDFEIAELLYEKHFSSLQGMEHNDG
jgi:CMP-N-acetylneuraminic acid synthetase